MVTAPLEVSWCGWRTGSMTQSSVPSHFGHSWCLRMRRSSRGTIGASATNADPPMAMVDPHQTSVATPRPAKVSSPSMPTPAITIIIMKRWGLASANEVTRCCCAL